MDALLPESKIWFVYLLRCADQSLYCGIARNPRLRLLQHNGLLSGGARYTRGRRPVQLLGAICVFGKAAACRLEYRIKKLPHPVKLAFFQAQ